MKNPIKIIPAILELTEESLKAQMEKMSHLGREIHIDYADGQFVETETVDWQILLDLPEYYHDQDLEIHIMAKEPLLIAQEALDRGFVRVIIPIEDLITGEIGLVRELTTRGEVYLSINPETSVETAAAFLMTVQGVTLLTVQPGLQGNPFREEVLDKITDLRNLNFKGAIELDGGINIETIEKIVDCDVSCLVVGSALTRTEDPRSVYSQLEQKLKKDSTI